MLISILEKRRSIREFTSQPVEPEKIASIIEAMLRAPSSRGIDPCEFIVIDDWEILGKLAQAKPHGGSFLKQAPLAVCVCADTNKADTHVEDASIAAIIIHLAAASLGLGSCWCQIRLRNHDNNITAQSYVRELLGIPERYLVEAIIAIGYPAEKKPAHSRNSLKYEKIFKNRYGQN